jgi:hypothetical protein
MSALDERISLLGVDGRELAFSFVSDLASDKLREEELEEVPRTLGGGGTFLPSAQSNA